MCGQALSWTMSGPATSNWGTFFCIFLRRYCSRGSRKFTPCTAIFKIICHKLHIYFICWCSRPSWSWAIVYAHTQPLRKRLAQQETVIWSTVNSPQTSLRVPWISGVFAAQSFVLNVWPLIWNNHSIGHSCRLYFYCPVSRTWDIGSTAISSG